jgi:CheY-like chemotaxis protein
VTQAEEANPSAPPAAPAVRSGVPVLVVEDRAEDRGLIAQSLRGSGFVPVEADRLSSAEALLATVEPAAVILDLMLGGEDSWRFIPEAARAGVPVIVTSTLDERRKGLALGAVAYGVKPISGDWLIDALQRAILGTRMRRLLKPFGAEILEAADGSHALTLAREQQAAIAARTPKLTCEYRVRHRDGRYIWVHDSRHMTYHPDGRLARVVGCTFSVDARRRSRARTIW